MRLRHRLIHRDGQPEIIRRENRGHHGQEKWPLFEKSGAKTSLNWTRGGEASMAQFKKSFLLLFFKKEALFFLKPPGVP
jgi:hypothetical protein